MVRKHAPPSPESAARAERQRLAKEEGVAAMAEIERHAVDVRQNMQRLKALREAQERETPPAVTPAKKARAQKATAKTAAAKTEAAKTATVRTKRAPTTSKAARG